MRVFTLAIGAALLSGCGNGGTNGDAGSEAGFESGAGDSSDDQTQCGVMLCVQNNQAPQCPSCSPSNGDICSPPAAVTCDYTNGCSGAALESSQCTCELPDASAGDAGDAGDASTTGTNAIWHCTFSV